MQTKRQKKICVIGAGQFGTCLAQHLATIENKVLSLSAELNKDINKKKTLDKFLGKCQTGEFYIYSVKTKKTKRFSSLLGNFLSIFRGQFWEDSRGVWEASGKGFWRGSGEFLGRFWGGSGTRPPLSGSLG